MTGHWPLPSFWRDHAHGLRRIAANYREKASCFDADWHSKSIAEAERLERDADHALAIADEADEQENDDVAA